MAEIKRDDIFLDDEEVEAAYMTCFPWVEAGQRAIADTATAKVLRELNERYSVVYQSWDKKAHFLKIPLEDWQIIVSGGLAPIQQRRRYEQH